MTEAARRSGLTLGAALLLAGCVPSTTTRAPAPPPAPVRPPPTIGVVPSTLIGHNAKGLEGMFGKPDLDVREGTARKLQFVGPACVLDAYLYPPRNGGDPVVTHVDARLPDGRDMDRASCIAALTRREQAR